MNSLLASYGINPAWLPLWLLVLFVGVAFFLSLAGGWRDLATSRTDENGRVRSFGDAIKTEAATYRLVFDMSRYGEPTTPPATSVRSHAYRRSCREPFLP